MSTEGRTETRTETSTVEESVRELREEEVEASLEDADIQTNTVSQWKFSLRGRIAKLLD